MAETIDEITINWSDENGKLVRKEIKKEVLTRGSWTTIMFQFQEMDRKTNEYAAPKVSIRRYKKGPKGYREQSKFTITNAKQAYQMMEILKRWYPENAPADAAGDDDAGDE
jgi:hypothetical protein